MVCRSTLSSFQATLYSQPCLDKLNGGVPKISGTFFGGPKSKDYSLLRSILGSPYFGKLPNIP